MFVNTQMFEEAYMGAALYNGQGPMLPLPPWMGPDMEATVPHPSTGQECSVQGSRSAPGADTLCETGGVRTWGRSGPLDRALLSSGWVGYGGLGDVCIADNT
jgi:hypothetical protein